MDKRQFKEKLKEVNIILTDQMEKQFDLYFNLLNEYNKDRFHLKHALTVEGVMRYFAEKLGYGDEVDFWGIVGLLHDLDFEI